MIKSLFGTKTELKLENCDLICQIQTILFLMFIFLDSLMFLWIMEIITKMLISHTNFDLTQFHQDFVLHSVSMYNDFDTHLDIAQLITIKWDRLWCLIKSN